MTDHRNSVVGLYNIQNDQMDEMAEYDPEGRTKVIRPDRTIACQEVGNPDVVCRGPANIAFGFNSMWRSPVSGLVYMRNRFYSPRLGQFISHDPLGYIDSYNPYQFALFDPINSWDPWGLASNSLSIQLASDKPKVCFNSGRCLDDPPTNGADPWKVLTGVGKGMIEGAARTGCLLLAAAAGSAGGKCMKYVDQADSFKPTDRGEEVGKKTVASVEIMLGAAAVGKAASAGAHAAVRLGGKLKAKKKAKTSRNQSPKDEFNPSALDGDISPTRTVDRPFRPPIRAKRINRQKQERHLPGTAEPTASTMDSLEDAQSVLDAYKSGKGRVIGTD
jgi:RHS repeat-associated protein